MKSILALLFFSTALHAEIGLISPVEAKKLIENPDAAQRPIVLDTRGGYHYTGGFTTDYSHEEMAVEMARRAITVLKRYGWQLFRNDDI